MTTSLPVLIEKAPPVARRSFTVPEFDLGPVVPVQFYDLLRRSAFLDGETRLVFAVLEDAVRTYLRERDSRQRSGREEFAEVAQWFEASSGSVPLSFEYVCEVLEIDAVSFRSQLRSLQGDVLPTKQLRSVGRRQVIRTARYVRKRSVGTLRLKNRELHGCAPSASASAAPPRSSRPESEPSPPAHRA